MIGLGPHRMTTWLWAFSVGLTVAFAALAAVSISIAVRATESRRDSRTNRYPAPVVAADAKRRRPSTIETERSEEADMYWHDGWDCPWSGKVAPADVELLQASDDPEEICALVGEGDRRQRVPVASDGR